MPKTDPTTTTSTQLTNAATGVRVAQFVENQHRGHRMTRVGSFTDPREPNTPHEVVYCQVDHALLVA